jgi:hypothetical protein
MRRTPAALFGLRLDISTALKISIFRISGNIDQHGPDVANWQLCHYVILRSQPEIRPHNRFFASPWKAATCVGNEVSVG